MIVIIFIFLIIAMVYIFEKFNDKKSLDEQNNIDKCYFCDAVHYIKIDNEKLMLINSYDGKIEFQEDLLHIKRINLLQEDLQYLQYTYYSSGELMKIKKVTFEKIMNNKMYESQYLYKYNSTYNKYKKICNYYIKIEYIKDTEIIPYIMPLYIDILTELYSISENYKEEILKIKDYLNLYKKEKEDREILKNVPQKYYSSIKEVYNISDEEWDEFILYMQNNKKYCENFADFINYMNEYSSLKNNYFNNFNYDGGEDVEKIKKIINLTSQKEKERYIKENYITKNIELVLSKFQLLDIINYAIIIEKDLLIHFVKKEKKELVVFGIASPFFFKKIYKIKSSQKFYDFGICLNKVKLNKLKKYIKKEIDNDIRINVNKENKKADIKINNEIINYNISEISTSMENFILTEDIIIKLDKSEFLKILQEHCEMIDKDQKENRKACYSAIIEIENNSIRYYSYINKELNGRIIKGLDIKTKFGFYYFYMFEIIKKLKGKEIFIGLNTDASSLIKIYNNDVQYFLCPIRISNDF